MKPLPDLDDTQAMAQTGRRSVLMRARNEACEGLRNAAVAVQSAELADVDKAAEDAIAWASRLITVANLWRITNGEPENLEPALRASLSVVKT
jgi:hypothetical protein